MIVAVAEGGEEVLGVVADVIEEEVSPGLMQDVLAVVLADPLQHRGQRVVSLDGAGFIVPYDGPEFRAFVPPGAVREFDDVLHAAILDSV